jgi:putative endonuclease
MSIDRKAFGAAAEQAVGSYLQEQGFTIIAYNYFARVGELDIVARKQELIVFVEVKARKSSYFPLSSVIIPSKQRKIVQAARCFILDKKLTQTVWRFDVAFVYQVDGKWVVDYRPHAFEPEGF